MIIHKDDSIIVYQWMYNLDASLYELFILALIYSYPLGITCTQEYIKDRTNMSLITVKRTIKSLKQKGYIEAIKGDGRQIKYICNKNIKSKAYEHSLTNKAN